jgi:hypothetical protein
MQAGQADPKTPVSFHPGMSPGYLKDPESNVFAH